jgi:exosortase
MNHGQDTAIAVRVLSVFNLRLTLILLAACTLWAYWPTLVGMAFLWSHNPQYSHGFLVPVFAAVVLWARRPNQSVQELRPSWWAIPLLAAAIGLRLAGGYVGLGYLEGPSLVATLTALCVLIGGGAALRWAWPALVFLAFMLPLPYKVETALGQPLRGIATALSAYALQTLGWPALAEGNVIVLDDFRLGVIDACSGLGMLMTFFALSTAVALVVPRPLEDRLIIVLSAVPIAVLANVGRITATGVVYQTLGEEAAHAVFHDLAGWLMMPLALALLGLELVLLSALLGEPSPAHPVPLDLFSDRRPEDEPDNCDATPSVPAAPSSLRPSPLSLAPRP